VIIGVFRERVVTAFDITGWRWETDAERAAALSQGLSRDNSRLVFEVVPSQALGTFDRDDQSGAAVATLMGVAIGMASHA
jgi:hypothetical protein